MPARADLLGAGAVALAAGAAAVLGETSQVETAAALVAALALAWVRSRPVAVLAVVAPALAAAALASSGDPQWVVLVASAFAFACWSSGAVVHAAAATVVVVGAVAGTDDDGSLVPLAMTCGAAWFVGRAVHGQRAAAQRLAERAAELEAERDAYAQLSVRYERARIAAELHDIVAHAISVMVVQAAAGQRLARLDPSRTGEAFEAIADAARQAEGDLERLVALLSDEEPIGDAPDLRLVEELVDSASRTGLDIRLDLGGDRDGLPAATVAAAYRIVQESITNALRYAAGADVHVVVRGNPSELLVSVRNGAPARTGALEGQGTGNGLRGLRERLGALGGTLDAGPTAEGGWAVDARLPRRPPALA